MAPTSVISRGYGTTPSQILGYDRSLRIAYVWNHCFNAAVLKFGPPRCFGFQLPDPEAMVLSGQGFSESKP